MGNKIIGIAFTIPQHLHSITICNFQISEYVVEMTTEEAEKIKLIDKFSASII